jgi:hypothetical protein
VKRLKHLQRFYVTAIPQRKKDKSKKVSVRVQRLSVNPARRVRLENFLYLELSRSSNGYFKVLLDRRTAVSEVKRALRKRFGSGTATNLQRLGNLYATAIPQRTQVYVRV